MPAGRRKHPLASAIFAAGLFLTIGGARYGIIDHYGSDVPYWDQWGAEGESLYTPWFQHGELWRNLFQPHSEHRIAPTKALNLGLVMLGGQWDARVQCAVNALFVAAGAAAIFLWTSRQFGWRWGLGAGFLLAVLLGLPLAVENIVGGFQSQFYFLIGGSLLAMATLAAATPFTAGWWGGLVAGFVAFFSMGSGFFFSLPLALIAGRKLLTSSRRRDDWIALGISATIAAVGWWTRPRAPWQAVFNADNLHDFFSYFIHCLAWPLPAHTWLVILWMPWVIVFWRWLVRGPRPNSTPNDLVVAGGVWVLLQIVAVAYSRGHGGGLPPSRYADLLSIGLCFCFLSLAVLAEHFSSRRVGIIGAVWLVLSVSAAVVAVRPLYVTDLRDKKRQAAHYVENLQSYLLTDDPGYLHKTPVEEIPLFSGDVLERILRPAEIRRILPVSIRAPIRVKAGPAESIFSIDGFSPATPLLNHRVVWGSYPIPGGHASPEWSTEVLPSTLSGYWKFEVAGQLGQPGFSLELVSDMTRKVLAEILPSRVPGNAWRAVYVPAPDEGAYLRARSSSATGWFAFSEPVEMSSLSYWVWRLVEQAAWIQGAGLVLLGIATFMALVRRNPPAELADTTGRLVH